MNKDEKLSTYLNRVKKALNDSFEEPTWVYGKVISFKNDNKQSFVELSIEDVSPDKDTPAYSSARIWVHNKEKVLAELAAIVNIENIEGASCWFYVRPTVTPRFGFQLSIESAGIKPIKS